MVTPRQVLDEQAALLDYVQNPEYVQFAARHIVDKYERSIQLLDKNPRHDALLAKYEDAWAKVMPAMIATAYAFHVSDEMVDLANWAGHLLPEDITLRADLLPTQTGFVMFEHGVEIPEIWGRRVYIHALLWRSGLVRDSDPGVQILTFVDFHDRRDEVSQEVVKDLGEERVEEAMRSLGHLHLSNVVEVSYRDPQPSIVSTPEDYQQNETEGLEMVPFGPNWVRTLIAIFTLMGQTVTTVTEIEADRHQARRMRRMRLPQRVTVITLRRTKGAQREEGESQVEWQHRWMVRGHWAWRHCGEDHPFAEPDGSGGLHARVWINPYVKGPDDKPMVITDKVYALRR